MAILVLIHAHLVLTQIQIKFVKHVQVNVRLVQMLILAQPAILLANYLIYITVIVLLHAQMDISTVLTHVYNATQLLAKLVKTLLLPALLAIPANLT